MSIDTFVAGTWKSLHAACSPNKLADPGPNGSLLTFAFTWARELWSNLVNMTFDQYFQCFSGQFYSYFANLYFSFKTNQISILVIKVDVLNHCFTYTLIVLWQMWQWELAEERSTRIGKVWDRSYKYWQALRLMDFQPNFVGCYYLLFLYLAVQ